MLGYSCVCLWGFKTDTDASEAQANQEHLLCLEWIIYY